MLLAFGVVAAAEGPTYKLGRPATEEELRQPAAAIRPDATDCLRGVVRLPRGAMT